jgi:thiamine pyrophosphate-dependent acetolactate synthase large subunit-like protein
MVATLKASGVRRVYGIPGDSLNGFTDALRRDGTIDWQHVRHEEAAAFAAAGEAGIARAAGLFSARVEKAGDLEQALQAAFAHDGPALVDVATFRHELAMPPKLAYGQIKGFTLYATRTIVSVQGLEIVELAKTNLRELEVE